MTDAQLLFWSAIIAAVLAFVVNRQNADTQKKTAESTVTKSAFDGLAETITVLRSELTLERETRERENKEHNKAIAEEKEFRNAEFKLYQENLTALGLRLEKQFEEERDKYRKYIQALHKQLAEANLVPVEWEPE